LSQLLQQFSRDPLVRLRLLEASRQRIADATASSDETEDSSPASRRYLEVWARWIGARTTARGEQLERKRVVLQFRAARTDDKSLSLEQYGQTVFLTW